MVVDACPDLASARVLDNGCGIGTYITRLEPVAGSVYGLEYELGRTQEAVQRTGSRRLVNGAGERLPFADQSFDLILSNEVIEHVQDDRAAVAEMVRVLKPRGRAVIFCPNRWYPVEQHGVYWRGHYHFGNIPLVNYLPDRYRNRLAPHVRTYTAGQLRGLVEGLPVRVVRQTRIFGAYDNLIARFGPLAELLRWALQRSEQTPIRFLGLSHLLVIERVPDP